MNKQEIYDTVKKHLLTQMYRSQNNAGDCLYRGPNGLKCALGVLISDENFDRMRNSHSLINEGVLNMFRRSGIDIQDDADFEFLFALQNIHDHSHPSRWKALLSELAEKEGLIP